MHKPITRTLILLACIGLLAACDERGMTPAPAVFKPVKAHVQAVRMITRDRPLEVYGVVHAARQTDVSSRVSGPVIAVLVDAGEVVRKDQELLKIQPQTTQGQVAQAQGALQEARATLVLAEKNYQRFQKLFKRGTVSDLQLDQARTRYKQARGAVEQARGALESARSLASEAWVRAPFSARVVDKLVEVGDLATPGRPLIRLESLSGRKIWLNVREADIRRLREGQRIPVRFDNRPDLGRVQGRVDEIIAAADPTTHTFTVKVSLDGVDVRSGISGRAYLPGDEEQLLVIPDKAVHRRGGLELVVPRDAGGLARTLAVTTGRKLDDGSVEILSGLHQGQQVAIDLPAPVADGTPVTLLP